MIVGGIDVGSRTIKTVLLMNENVIGHCVIPTGINVIDQAEYAMVQVLDGENLSLSDLEYIVATGYGRVNVPFAQKTITEISCHARGTNWLFPSVRTILDMGGQDCKAIRCTGTGKVQNFVMNDKCAAGTGRYLERVAAILNLPLDSSGRLSLCPVNGPENISSFCVIYAETDITRLVRDGRPVNDILSGAYESIVSRVGALLDRVRVVPDFSLSGGVAKNIGVVRRLEERLGLKALIAPYPEIVGAIGAALFAQEYALVKSGSNRGT